MGKKGALPGLLLFLAVTAGAGLFLSPRTGAPFDRSFQGWNPAWYGIAARNYLRRGVLKLRFGMILDCGLPSPAPTFYTDHPPMAALLCAGSFSLFGEGEAQARGVALLLSALSAGLFFLFLRNLSGGHTQTALLGTALYLGTPLLAYYGNMLDPQGSGVLFSMAGAIWAAERWARWGLRKDLLASLAFLAFGLFYDWPSFFLAFFLGAWALRAFGKRRKLQALSFWLAGLAAGLVLLAWILSLESASALKGGIWQALESRIPLGGMKDLQGRPLDSWKCFLGILALHKENFHVLLSILGLLGALILVRNLGRLPPSALLLLLPLLVGLAHVVLFPQGAYIHDYWQIYLAPGLAFPAAWLLGRTAAMSPRLRRVLLPLFLLLGLAAALLGFHQARERWKGHEPFLEEARLAGKYLRKETLPGRFVLSSAVPVLAVNFYSDRQIVWGMKTPSMFEKTFGPWEKTGPFVGAFLLEAQALRSYGSLLDASARKVSFRAGRFLIFRKK